MLIFKVMQSLYSYLLVFTMQLVIFAKNYLGIDKYNQRLNNTYTNYMLLVYIPRNSFIHNTLSFLGANVIRQYILLSLYK